MSKKTEWLLGFRKSCKQKCQNLGSSGYCIYCRKYGGSCTFKNCKAKGK